MLGWRNIVGIVGWDRRTSIVAKHTLELSHRIDWASADIIYKENHVGRRRVVEGDLIQLLETFENNKSFTQEDVITNILICKSAKANLNSLSTAPTAQAFSLSSAQVLADSSSSPSSSTGHRIFRESASCRRRSNTPPNHLCGRDS